MRDRAMVTQRPRLWPRTLLAILAAVSSGCVVEHAAAQSAPCGTCSSRSTTAEAPATQPMTNFFGNPRHLQATSDQVDLSRQGGPLPVTISGNVQAWTSGPAQPDLYTEIAQLSFKLTDDWSLLGQQLYQRQSSIELWNFVGGFGYHPNDEFSLNMMAGFGLGTLYTYQWAAYVSPQYTLPLVIADQKRIALGANFTMEQYELGTFRQVQPRVSVNVAPWLPQLQVGYSLGEFSNSTDQTQTQYYQPQPVNGLTMTAVLHPAEPLYAVLSYLPENRNYIAGNYVVQNTVSGTLHLNITQSVRTSIFYQDNWYDGGADQAVGGSLSVAF